ncbi:MAG TPA: hypothetical protein VKV03_11765 [Candidatus Binataceae bacterium]|nr:hypothetical protein [Candidatus Binataceae bacterium]
MDKSTANGNSTRRSDSQSRPEDRTLTELVQEQPVVSLAIAAATGFVLGGGMRARNGVALLALIGQIAMRDALGNIVSGALGNSHDG